MESSTMSAVSAVQPQNENGDNEEQPLSLRRSKRDLNAIKLGGSTGNQMFVQRLSKLFFNKRGTSQEIESILLSGASRRSSNSSATMQVSRATQRRQAPIYVMDNFLTEAELEYFDQKIKSCVDFQRSFVDNMNCDNENDEGEKSLTSRKRKRRTLVDDQQRTSTFYPFKKLQDSRVAALEQRIADLLGCWVHQIEPLQLVRYEPGQFFGIHHDMGDLKDDDTVELPKKDLTVKRRLVTIFCYLNTLVAGQGGATYFPKCGHLRVNPVRGRAVLWSNVTKDGQPDERTIHAGEAVSDNRKAIWPPSSTCTANNGKKIKKKPAQKEEGLVKYGLNIWICEE
jgi:prolyl 4-hydroxylase